MTPERWARVKEVFGGALELPEPQRSAFLSGACGSDAALRQDVERLLSADDDTLESPVSGVMAHLGPPELPRGEKLGHYRVDTKIGQGGMGAVYRAYDTRLDRRIALKVLPPEQLADPARRQRLIREARAASALSHPNIITVYDVGCENGIDYIAMEYVDGRALDQLIPPGGLPQKQALAYAVQIAAALAGAHSAGIVHRDLKPSNIIITREGLVKLLDFGLARRTGLAGSESGLTLKGEIVGTPAYMSPEQVRGDEVDFRSDIFSFGAVLFKLITGRDAFDRGAAVETMHAIVTADPAELFPEPRSVSYSVESILIHCLQQAPEDRFQSARDLAYALEASAGPVEAIPVPAGAAERLRRNAGWIAAIAASFALALALGWFVLADRGQPALDGRVFAQVTDDAGAELFPALAPDGQSVAYASKASGNWDIYLRRIGRAESVNLTKDSPDDDTQPAFSPDGRRIAFRSDREGGGIFLMQADGSAVRRLVNDGYNPAWSPDGKQIVYAEEGIARPEDRSGRLSRLWTADVAGGRKRLVTAGDAVQPQWSPGGRYLAYWAIDLDGARDIWTIPAGGGPAVRITHDAYIDWNPAWSPDGAWLYFLSNRGGTTNVWRVPIREGTGEARGAPEPVRTPAPYTAHLSFSRDGRRLAYVQQVSTGLLYSVRFDPVREVALSEPKVLFRSSKGAARPALSPDGQWLAFNSTEEQEDLFVVGLDGSGLRQLTSDGHRNRGPRWSPDGKRIAFFSTRSGDWEIWTMQADGTGLRQITNLAGQNVAWPVWSSDNRHLAYTIFGVNTFVLDTAAAWAEQRPERLPPVGGPGQLFNGWAWSPDGKLLAGFLNRGDGIAVYSLADRSYRRLSSIGADPVWLKDGRRLLFHHDGRIYILDVASGRSRELVSIAPEEVARRGFAVSPDDSRIYFSASTTEADVWVMKFER